MPPDTTLDIAGYRGEAVAHTFYRQERETRHLGILFAGMSYTVHMPAMYYPGRLLLARGADVLRVEYRYDRRAEFRAAPETEQERWLFTDVTAACDAALAQRRYDRITLVGKSLGTVAVGQVLAARPDLPGAECIWLTPLLASKELRARIKGGTHRALFVVGTADAFYDAAYLAEVQQATGGESIVIEGADHSLEIEGDVVRSIQAMEQAIRGMARFLS